MCSVANLAMGLCAARITSSLRWQLGFLVWPLLLLPAHLAVAEQCPIRAMLQTMKERRAIQHPKWLQSCRAIYLDVGTKQGIQVRKLFEPRLYEGSESLQLLEKHFGKPSDRCRPSKETGLCVLGLEPDERYHDRLRLLETTYTEMGWHIHFYLDKGTNSRSAAPKGSMIVNEEPQHEEDLSLASVPENVQQAADFAQFLRSLPPGRVRLMGMDVDEDMLGLLTHMSKENVLCGDVVTEAFLEVHDNATSLAAVGSATARTAAQRLNDLLQTQSCGAGPMQVTQIHGNPSMADVDDDFGCANTCFETDA